MRVRNSTVRPPLAAWLAPAALLGMGTAHAQNLIYPSDAGVIDVRNYGAVPNDGIDDTAAIQSALNAFPSGNTVFYFGNGTYDVTSTLVPAPSNGFAKRNIFQGQSRDGVVLKLADNLSGGSFSGAVIDYGAGAAQFFRNSVRDLTIDTGSGNPNAIGLRFNASNQGVVKNVSIRSGDGAGRYGLDMSAASEPGPLLVTGLNVSGFDVGIATRSLTASQTFENVQLTGQSQIGWHNTSSQTVFARNISSNNSATAILNNGEARMTLVDSSLTGGSNSNAAIRNQKAIFVRNTTTAGYAASITNELASNRGNRGLTGPYVEEYWANGAYNERRGGPFQLFDSPDTTLKLPVRQTPSVPIHPTSQWARPTGVASGADATAAIQAAIDSGAKTIYLPRGAWRIDGTVIIRGNVERITGAEARLEGAGKIRVEQGNGQPVIIERLEVQGNGVTFEQASTRDMVLSSLLGGKYRSAVASPGDLFIEDVAIAAMTVKNQSVWARQLNVETDTEAASAAQNAKIINDNGTLWILGYKTEDPGTLIKTINGGKTELLGSLHVSRHGNDPMFVTENASFSAVGFGGANGTVRETRNGVTHTGSLGAADIYTAFSADAIRSREVIYDNKSAAFAYTGSWGSTDEFAGGFIEDDAAFSTSSGATATLTPDLPGAGAYRLAIRWIEDVSGQTHSGHANATKVMILTSTGWQERVVDMRINGGAWADLGTFQFDPLTAMIQFDAAGAGGKVIVDGVRFTIVPEPAFASALVALALLGRRSRRTREG